MGISTRRPRPLRGQWQWLSRLMDLRVVTLLFVLVVLSSTFFLLSGRFSEVAKVKTIVGDNLEPTPWHLFPKKELPSSDSYSRASYIFQCTYLSCSLPMRGIVPLQKNSFNLNNTKSCPKFFQWIHEDLAPWRRKGITRENLQEARKFAAFRVTIVNGRLYVDPYYDCFQSRMMFTIWGILQLLDLYPGMVPDVDMMFDCMDKPTIERSSYKSIKREPPPLLRYCNDEDHFDIPFPDWSFWGWTEVNLRPWDEEFNDIMMGSREVQWKDRRPTAYWKGNPDVASPTRSKLLECNNSDVWGAEILKQNWQAEAAEGYEKSKLSKQCKHRYKIYAEGYAWSVSFKYILSCDSPVLVVSPKYYDFFTRGLIPQEHYWPVRVSNLCPSIKVAVDWGNRNPAQAQAIGEAGQRFMHDLNMDTVYNYMFHLISEYSKLQRFKPQVPASSQEVCKASVLCLASPKEKDFLKRSRPSSHESASLPCSMPHAHHNEIVNWIDNNNKVSKEIASMEDAVNSKSEVDGKPRARRIKENPEVKIEETKPTRRRKTKRKRGKSQS